MDFEFSDEQKLIGEQARSFLQKECTSEVVRQVLDTDAPYAESLWQQMAELGWMGIAIPEEYGGLGFSYLELAVIAQEIGRSLAPVPFSSSVYLATEALLLAGSPAQKEKWLPELASGSVIGTLATHALQQGRESIHPQLCASGETLQGKALLVPDAEIADFCVLLCREDDGQELSLVVLDLAQPGVCVTPAQGTDSTRNVGDLSIDNARVERLGEKGAGPELLTQLSRRAAVLFAWEQLGGSDAALEQAKDYAMGRFAFGRPIASFQAIKHKLAHGAVKNMLARSNCYYGAWALNTDAPELELAAATARVSSSQAYYYSSKENIHTHGGMGFTWEFDCHLHYRRAKYLSVVIAGEAAWKKRLTSVLLERDQSCNDNGGASNGLQ